jgi:ABC-type dipeptide/oligopeptide/nickel transport system permease component
VPLAFIKNIFFYIGQRIILTIIALVVLSFITFSLSYIVPGDAALVAAGPNAGKVKIEQLRREMGLNLPFHEQYIIYFSKLSKGDLGKSWFTHQPILEDIKDLLPASTELVFFAMLFNILIAIPLGVLAATKRDTKTDLSIRILVMFGAGIPIFWLGLLLQHFLAGEAELFPIAGRLSFSNRNFESNTGFILIDSIVQGEWSVFVDSLWHIILPSFTLSVLFIAVITRTTRSTVMKALEEDFIILARSKGISEFSVVVKHALRNALVPTVTILGMQVGWMMGATVLVEEIFGRPGIGKYAVKAVTQSDIHAIVGVVLIVGVIFIISNLIVDIIHFFLNPRLRNN